MNRGFDSSSAFLRAEHSITLNLPRAQIQLLKRAGLCTQYTSATDVCLPGNAAAAA